MDIIVVTKFSSLPHNKDLALRLYKTSDGIYQLAEKQQNWLSSFQRPSVYQYTTG